MKAPFRFPQYVIDRVLAKRGRLRVFDAFAARETALCVIDMQTFYVADIPPALAIVPAVNRLAAGVRERGGLVAWINMTAGDAGRSLWPIYHEHFFTPEKAARHRDNLTAGTPGHALHPALETRPDDLHLWKTRFSAFLPGACPAHEEMQRRGIRNLLFAGTATNFCCETSARDAMMLDYRVVMVSDANAARYEEDHLVGLTTVFQSFGDVLTVDEVLGDLLRS